jgi:hypothetical protein
MLGLGVSLGRGGAPQVQEPYKEYASDFSAGIDLWSAVTDSPAITPTAPTTLGGVDDALVFPVATDDVFIMTKPGILSQAEDSNNTMQVTADVYIDSSTSTGELQHIAGSYFQTVTDLTVTVNTWTTVSFTEALPSLNGTTLGFKAITATALSDGDKIGIKNYVVKFYD